MPLVSVNRVMEENLRRPDFLSTDTEGLDFDILRSLDFDRFRPAIVCAEALAASGRVESRIPELMTTRGYSMRGSTWVNAIFVDDRRGRPDRASRGRGIPSPCACRGTVPPIIPLKRFTDDEHG